jgi:hypothetical protein
MEQAVRYIELTNAFIIALLSKFQSAERIQGRRFDRISCNGAVEFFIDRNTWEIFGAKSDTQFNPRRHFGTLETVAQFDWVNGVPVANTTLAITWLAKEAELTKDHKPRGRPKKIAAVQPTNSPDTGETK